MARETKAQQLAREAAMQAEQEMVRAMSYPTHLMEVLERATKMNYELTVELGKFRLWNRDDSSYEGDYLLDLRYSKAADRTLDDLELSVQGKEEAAAEAERRRTVRANAMAKLSAEEREALGL